ncbi:hypothetical protein CNMCM8694_002296 [Aspergillus lentulus]|nr:hypothetical protein CNMCM8060_005493 [Aspergillus lentulus]KAF4185764.1 hypothetical protein CNMCM7927_006322 [Aspergillus lentulus]KAF4191176.1 hypothetical protein CNMCM8694_002296 [Aspergillus lentulus]
MSRGASYDILVPLQDFHSARHPRDTNEIHQEPTSSNEPVAPHRVSIDSSGSLRIKEDGQDRPKVEPRKILIRRNRSTAVRYFLQFHVIPLAAAIALIVLNIQTRFLGTDSQWFSLLQFIAKFHEILMQISIATALGAYQQYLLTQPTSGVPFGAIFSAYHTTQVGYLWSPEFRASLTTPGFPLLLKMGFVLFVPASILLASAVGPASAIAMLPRHVNFSIPDYQLALDHAYSDVFPTAFIQPGSRLVDGIYNQNEQSPAIGWEYLRDLPSVGQDQPTLVGTQQAFKDLGDGYGKSVEEMPPLYSVGLLSLVPRTQSLSETFTRTLYVQFAPNGTVATVQQVPIAAGLSRAVISSLAGMNNPATVGEASIRIAHPVVSTICTLNAIMDENDTRTIQFPVTYFAANATAVETTPYTNITRRQLWDQIQKQGQGQILWVDDVHFSTERTLGAIVVQPALCDNVQEYIMVATNGSATEFDQRVESLLPRDFLNALPAWPPHAVSISKDWANSITTQIANQNRTVADNLLRSLLLTENVCPVNGSYPLYSRAPRPMMHEAIVSSLVANGMSHAAGPFNMSAQNLHDGTFRWVTRIGDLINPPGLILTFQSHVLGFAWNMDGTAIRIAISILILYCLYATIYVVYTFVTGHSSHAWDTISSITALAFNSRPTKVLENTSVRISQTETFRNLVSVKELEAEKRLELVFQQDEQDRGPVQRVRAGKSYS